MTIRSLFFVVASLALAGAASATDSAPPAVRAAVLKLAPHADVSEIAKAPLPGFYQVLVGGRLVYVSADGTYVMDGHLFDAPAQRDLTEDSMDAIRRQALAAVPASHRIVFAPPHPKYTVTVFTDLDCAYCRALHEHIAQFNKDGIAVEYLFWPRDGLVKIPSGRPTDSYAKSVSVWCSPDRKAEFTAAKAGKAIKPATCPNPVADEYHLGERIGITGTPTIIAADGSILGGYLTPDQLLQTLQALRR
ncbi:MAG TPA: DsbC family protein [Rhodanobacteraceae bacterium]|nr:DsbC family protein [Rhodanobacteraceae bacterium]